MVARFFLVLALFFSALTIVSGCVSLAVVDEETLRFKTPTELYNSALDQHDRGQYKKARGLFHQYINQYPDSKLFYVALYYLGHCYQMGGDEKEAETLYHRVIESSEDTDFWGRMARKRLRQIKGEPDEPDQE